MTPAPARPARRELGRSAAVAALALGLGACAREQAEEPAPTAAPVPTPDEPLILASLGSAAGPLADGEESIATALAEAMIDVNASADGVFGHSARLLDRKLVDGPEDDLVGIVQGFAEAGASAVISSLDEETLAAALPALTEQGLAVLDITTSGMSVRAADVDTAGMLLRLSPSMRMLAVHLAEDALAVGTGDDGTAPGTVTVLTEETAAGTSLTEELSRVLDPAGGAVLAEHRYPVGGPDEARRGEIVQAVLAEPTALLILHGGDEAGALLAALHTAAEQEEKQAPPVCLFPRATIDRTAEELPEGTLDQVTGFRMGGALPEDFANLLLNADAELRHPRPGRTQQAYDAVVLAALAAEAAASRRGSALATALPRLLTGAQACTTAADCAALIREARTASRTPSTAYRGVTGELVLGESGDPVRAEVTPISYDASGAAVEEEPRTLELEE